MLFLILCLITENLISISGDYIVKAQSTLIMPNNRKYTYPLFNNLTMVVGESICLIFYYSIFKKRETKKVKTSHKAIMFLSIIDAVGSLFQGVILISVPISITVLFQSVQLLFTMAGSWIFLGTIPKAHALVGIAIQIFGNIFTVKSLIKTEVVKMSAFIIIVLIISKILNMLFFVIQEKTMKNNEVHPTQIVGLTGIYGIPINLVILLILSYIKCTPFIDQSIEFCSEGVIENMFSAFELNYYWPVLKFTILYCLDLFLLNYLSATIVNLTSALTSFIISALKVLLYWYIDILMGRDVYDSTRMVGTIIQMVGIAVYFGVFSKAEKKIKNN